MSRKEKRKLEKLKKSKRRKKIINIIGIVICFVIIFFIKHDQAYLKIVDFVNKRKQQPTLEVVSEKSDLKENTIEDEKVEEVESLDIVEESTKVKQIIEKEIKDKNLNSDNFAFFYYDPVEKECYFYNETKFFTAASTVKVPIALIYYNKIENGELKIDDTLEYKEDDYENGNGSTNARYKVSDNIPISFLIKEMIVNSDNTATNILKNNLGDRETYRSLVSKFTIRELPENFSTDNIISAGFGYDVMKYVYDNQEKYKELIEYMKISSNGGYLKKYLPVEIAHKYGSFEENVHDYGIVYGKNKTYLIGIFTQKVADAEELISNISKEIYESNNK